MFTLSTYLLGSLFFTNCAKKDAPEKASPEIVSAMREVPTDVGFENGYLVFEDQAHFDRTLDALNEAIRIYEEENQTPYNEDAPDRDDPVIVNPILLEFEKQYPEFYSLRTNLENQRRELMLAGTWGPENDPQNFYVPDNTYRTLLNNNLEVKIGGSIYKYLDKYTLAEILENDLQSLEILRNNQGDGTLNNTIFHDLGETGKTASTSGCDFGAFYADRKVTGKRLDVIGRPGNSGCDWKWNFGDGSAIKTGQVENHTYANSEKYILTYESGCTSIYGCGDIKYYVIETSPNTNCNNNPLSDSFNYNVILNTGGMGYEVDATNITGGATEYVWDFGDKTPLEYGKKPKHYYKNPAKYTIKMTATNGTGCYFEYSKTVTVTKDGAIVPSCCEEGNKTYYDYVEYKQDERKYYAALWRHNAKLYHRVGVETKNFKKKNGKWKDHDGEKIWAKLEGYVQVEHKYSDGSWTPPCLNKDEKQNVFCYKEKSNKDNTSESTGVGKEFATVKNSITSEHGVYFWGAWHKTNYVMTDSRINNCN